MGLFVVLICGFTAFILVARRHELHLILFRELIKSNLLASCKISQNYYFLFFFKYMFMHFSKEFLNLEVIVPKSWFSYTSEGGCGSFKEDMVFFLANAVKI